ncbi:MAG: AAA family ATPase [Rikenellaceae bacterium]|nr:AAA family ATPase [Rikenellaceae bacterium]
MKIEAIRGRNLASLEGDFTIDFTCEPLRSAGIYVITGRTGSGKSTILDAVCLSLFDQTPRGRLGESIKTDDGITMRDSRIIMRKGTTECYAETDFVALSGDSYRARWSCRRAYGKVTGALRDSEMSLRNLTAGIDEPGKKRELLARISELCGFTFDQFTRAVMLAQGDFATFLRADRKEKAELLEKLTGTDIYSRISAGIYRHHRDTEQELRLVEEQVRGVSVLSDQERATLTDEKERAQKRLQAIEASSSQISEKIKWIEGKVRLDSEMAAAQCEHDSALSEYEKAAPRRELLQRIDSVQEIRDQFNMLRHTHERLTKIEADTAASNAEAEELRLQMPQTEDYERLCGQKLTDREQESAAAAEDIRQARIADTDIKVAAELLRSEQERLATLERRHAEAAERLKEDADKLTARLEDNAPPLADPADKALLDRLEPALSELKATLHDGVPCPLCGSCDHPAVHGSHGDNLREQYAKELAATRQKMLDDTKAEADSHRRTVDIAARRLADLKAKRASMLGGMSADDKERSLALARAEAEKAHAKAKEQLAALVGRLEKLSAVKAHLTEQYSAHKERHSMLSAEVTEWIDKRGITKRQITDLLSYDLGWLAQERSALEAMHQRVTAAQATLLERSRNLALHLKAPERPSDTETLESLNIALQDMRQTASTLSTRISELHVTLGTDEHNRLMLKTLEEKSDSIRSLLVHWERLNDLFGSATGDKFKSIAQGYTLETLVSFSNVHLAELSSRYRLLRRPDTLILEVVDLDMLNQTRPVNSLSGGESFLVSLALALGLASLSGGELRVESLFIDEGFGSLDADTMRTAIDALEKLHVSGRKIGVISHVAELSDRIPVQIKVTAQASGGSKIKIYSR